MGQTPLLWCPSTECWGEFTTDGYHGSATPYIDMETVQTKELCNAWKETYCQASVTFLPSVEVNYWEYLEAAEDE